MASRSRSLRAATACALISISIGACGPRSRGLTCEWANEPASTLDLAKGADRRHLARDARTAEELAIRYADVQRGHRSGQFKGNDEYRQTRELCLATLSRAVAENHDITPAQVMDVVGRRDERLDATVLLLVAALFGFVVNVAAQRIAVRFLPDEPWPALIGTAVSALFVSAAGVIIGSVFASMVEMVWVGDTHLSYRAFRIPWNEHWLRFYAGFLALFCVIAAARLGVRWRGRKLAE